MLSKWPVTDFHHEKITLTTRPATVRAVAGNAQAIAFDSDFEAVTFHAGQFHLDDKAAVGGIHVRVRHPMSAGRAAVPA